MPDLKELREKRQALLPRMNELRDQANDEGQDWGAEQEENWKAINDEYNALVRQIEDLEKRAAVAEAVDVGVVLVVAVAVGVGVGVGCPHHTSGPTNVTCM